MIRYCKCHKQMARKGKLWVCRKGTCNRIRFDYPTPPKPEPLFPTH